MENKQVRYATWLDEFIDSHEDLKTSMADLDKEVRHANQQQIARSIRGFGGK
ncbi:MULTISPECIES: hypothetical protein [Leuconostoc]|uniref:hypothetical protein n=1 Tax=Leuconostoc TaxID=1243 RepID=UPI0002738A8A|nr:MULTISPECIES: hypothetical protein [Leuconostoc]CCJ66922.1 hypothetical protein Q5C_05875 [Leuconostoc pseudomesenteroides 4882]